MTVRGDLITKLRGFYYFSILNITQHIFKKNPKTVAMSLQNALIIFMATHVVMYVDFAKTEKLVTSEMENALTVV